MVITYYTWPTAWAANSWASTDVMCVSSDIDFQ